MDKIDKKRKRRSHDIMFKLQVVEYAKKNTGGAAAKKFNVDTKRVQQWKKQEEQLLGLVCGGGAPHNGQMNVNKMRLSGGGRKKISPELEELVFQWIIQQNKKNIVVTRKSIRAYAKHLHSEMKIEKEFLASVGWLNKFLKRHHLPLELG
mmetsp:Transcript_995/g.1506  ORF Transcript_995/g.1506 Transcript_995/m.1506 type:complete len:150 (-) Transcript_995:27-476(-)